MKVIINERQYLLLIESSEKETKELLIVGDSHSEDIGGYTYSSMIKAAYPGTEIVAERGKSTSWMKKQLEKELGENKYNKVIIWGGTNDLFGGVPSSTAIRNIQEMIDMVNEQGGKAYVVIGYNQETFSKKGGFKKNKEVMEKGRENYLDFQQELPNSIKGATIIPSFDFDTSYVSGDNLHGNIKAHKRVYDIITDYLEKKEDVKKVDVEPEDKKYEEEPKKEKTYSSEASKILKNIQNYIDDGDTFEMYKSKPIPVSEKVRDIQKVLQYLKFSLPEWGADGRFGRETRKAVMSFQDSVGIESNGIVDTETLRDLKDSAEKEDFDSFDTSKLEIEKKSELETVKPSNDLKLSDTGVEVESYPSDLDSKFRDVTGDYYDDFINDCSSIGLDPEVAMKQLYTESRFSPSVVSCKRKSIAGAMGIAQIMPSTWSTYGDGNVCKVEDSLKAYIKIMKDLMKMFPGRLDLAIAGYNSGPWYKDKSTKKEVYKDAYENDIPFKELYSRIPKETFKYASTILQA